MWIEFREILINTNSYYNLMPLFDEKHKIYKLTFSHISMREEISEQFKSQENQLKRYQELKTLLTSNDWNESYILELEKQVNFLTNELLLRKTANVRMDQMQREAPQKV